MSASAAWFAKESEPALLPRELLAAVSSGDEGFEALQRRLFPRGVGNTALATASRGVQDLLELPIEDSPWGTASSPSRMTVNRRSLGHKNLGKNMRLAGAPSVEKALVSCLSEDTPVDRVVQSLQESLTHQGEEEQRRHRNKKSATKTRRQDTDKDDSEDDAELREEVDTDRAAGTYLLARSGVDGISLVETQDALARKLAQGTWLEDGKMVASPMSPSRSNPSIVAKGSGRDVLEGHVVSKKGNPGLGFATSLGIGESEGDSKARQELRGQVETLSRSLVELGTLVMQSVSAKRERGWNSADLLRLAANCVYPCAHISPAIEALAEELEQLPLQLSADARQRARKGRTSASERPRPKARQVTPTISAAGRPVAAPQPRRSATPRESTRPAAAPRNWESLSARSLLGLRQPNLETDSDAATILDLDLVP